MAFRTNSLFLFALIAFAAGCKNTVWNKGKEYCIDPCDASNVVFTGDGFPQCLLYGNNKVCPPESIAYNAQHIPRCILTMDGDPCPIEDILYNWRNSPNCYSHCGSVAYFFGIPVCLPCLTDQVSFDYGIPHCIQ